MTTSRESRLPSWVAGAPPRQVRRLGLGLLLLGAAGVAHLSWGVVLDPLLLGAGAAGLCWALFARHAPGLLAGIVLTAVALTAFLEDHGALTGTSEVTMALLLAVVLALAGGLPTTWGDARPIAPAGVLVLVAAFGGLRLLAIWAAWPWELAAVLLVTVSGLALLVWDHAAGGYML